MAGRNAAVRMRAALIATIVVTLAFALSTSARAATIMVNSLADTGAPGICVLRDAITAANTMTAMNGCAAGTGDDTINFSVRGTIALASTLPQVTDSKLSINGPASPGITIDGGGQVQVMVVASGATVNLNKLTIAHGYSRGDAGGINNAGTLNVINSTFSGNSAKTAGGITNSGTLSITNSTFSGNSAVVFGGGIYNVNTCTLSITNSTFSGNGGQDGGGIYNAGTLSVTNSTFSSNTAFSGGGIGNAGTLTITNSTFSGNSAKTAGGISNGGVLTVTNSIFSGNSASGRVFIGGGGIGNAGTLTITNSTFSGNSANTSGGGIDNVFDNSLTVTNSTFSGNSATTGGEINNDDENGAVTHLKSTILTASGSGSNCAGTITDAGYNISDDHSCGLSATGSLNNTDPQLDPAGLANNGGPTKTIALLSGSPAIDAIPLADCTDQAHTHNPIITDQRLFPRPDSEEHLCDIGAYEFADAPFIPFSRFSGSLTIHPNTRVLNLNGSFKLGRSGNIDPSTQPVAFSIGRNALRLPVGSFVRNASGYVYQKGSGNSLLRISIQSTNTFGSYRLVVYQQGAPGFRPVPVTLTIGNNSGSTLMNVKFQ